MPLTATHLSAGADTCPGAQWKIPSLLFDWTLTMTPRQIALNDGTQIPQIGFGVFLIPEEETQRAVELALEAGYRHIDTASIYGNEKGVARAITATGLSREELYITTKLWNEDQGATTSRPALEASLERLGLDYVNLYLIHWPVPSRNLYRETWEVLEEAANDGLTRSIGVSNFMEEHLHTLAAMGGRIPVLNQIEVHPTLPQHDLVTANTAMGIATEAWSPLGRGADLEMPEVTAIASRIGATAAQVILAWHLQRGRIVLPKSVTPERIRENLAAAEITLSPTDLEALDNLDTGVRVGPDPATFIG